MKMVENNASNFSLRDRVISIIKYDGSLVLGLQEW